LNASESSFPFGFFFDGKLNGQFGFKIGIEQFVIDEKVKGIRRVIRDK
jgi:hypothetical protein